MRMRIIKKMATFPHVIAVFFIFLFEGVYEQELEAKLVEVHNI